MNLTLKNQIAGTRSYLGGLVTVAEDSSTTLPRDLNVIIISDAQFLVDIRTRSILLNNGVEDVSIANALLLFQALSSFTTDKLATQFLYYSYPVNIRQTTTASTGTTVWAIRNPLASTYSFVVDGIYLNVGFDGPDPIFSKTLKYELITFNTATPTGGTSISPNKASKIAPANGIDARYLDTGLTVTSVAFDSAFGFPSVPAIQGANAIFNSDVCRKLAPGEGLAIRIGDVTANIGQSITGEIVGSLR